MSIVTVVAVMTFHYKNAKNLACVVMAYPFQWQSHGAGIKHT